jgi:hypothetical protein
MNQHDSHHHGHDKQHHSKKQGLHKDWRLWVVVVLMLAAMAMYVLSDDESLQPVGPNGPAIDSPPVPAE